MARTGIFGALERLALEHRVAQSEGETPQRVREEVSQRLNRKDFACGIAAAAILPAFTFGTSSARERERIAVVGAGLAGLTAAMTLHDAGLTSTVYESATRIGGRLHSNPTYWENGQCTEWCGELIDSQHENMHRLSKRFALRLADVRAAQPVGARETVFLNRSYYPMHQVDRDFAKIYPILQEQLLQAGATTTYRSNTAVGRMLDRMSIKEWIDRYVPDGARSNLGQLLRQAYRNEYGREAHEQSSLNLLYLLAYQARFDRRGGMLNILGASDERYHIVGGNQRLTASIARSLPRGCLKTGHRLLSLRKQHDGRYHLRFGVRSATVSELYDRVVLAIPFSTLRNVEYSGAGFDALKLRAICELKYGMHTKLQLQFAQRFWQRPGPWPGKANGTIYTDLHFQNAWDTTRAQSGVTGIITKYTGGKASADDAASAPYCFAGSSPDVDRNAQTFLESLDRVWPGASGYYNGKATQSTSSLDPNLLGSYACWLVGDYTAFCGYEGVRQDRVHFAGEHCSVQNQGYMEGAAETGIAAAREILADYKVRVKPAA
ncbi:MAG: FAD-dependent oxidoreductase [Candidatus Eremiobacteraeota bacterium]|nr:FAD-dependent oxidoreductase [Candidatus Eremiobacteraeota bacterium]